MEYLMLQLRAKSVNNMITFNITDPDTQKPVEIELNIDDIKLTSDERHSKEINVSDEMRLIMRYPRLDEVALFKNYRGNEVNTLFDIMIACIDCVVDGDTVNRFEDFTKEESEHEEPVVKNTTAKATKPKEKTEIVEAAQETLVIEGEDEIKILDSPPEQMDEFEDLIIKDEMALEYETLG
jgi:hypothetical protein